MAPPQGGSRRASSTKTERDPHLIALLHELRNALGSDYTLSAASRRITAAQGQVAERLLARLAWSGRYYRLVAEQVDEIALMTYDSGAPLPALYRWWTRVQVVRASQALAEESVRLFIGVPTSEELTTSHIPKAENMLSGLLGVCDALCDPRTLVEAISGVAIYPYWETDGGEWATYEALWLSGACH